MLKKIAILGLAESGVGAARLAQKLGYTMFLSDKGIVQDKYKQQLEAMAIPYEEGSHTTAEILNADIIIKSPGISDKAPLILEAKAKGIEIISEIEFASRHTQSKVIAITGSNGKTTTTSLIHHLLKKGGVDAVLCGNIGDSFAAAVADYTPEYFVVEVSSFQLDGCNTFRPYIAVITNITEDHLDRYEYRLENYIKSKFRIANCQSSSDFLIYCHDDANTTSYLSLANSLVQKQSFGLLHHEGCAAHTENNKIIFHHDKNNIEMIINDLGLTGIHNTYNSMAAGIAAKLVGVRKDSIRESLHDFKSIAHRMEFVATVRGVDFINDSKATNVNSAWYALESMQKQTIWIVGGVDKGNDYTVLKDLVRSKVKAIICLGKDNDKIHEAFREDVGLIIDTQSAEAAVEHAFNIAEKDNVVLLSPACASFDLFQNYEDRGRQFCRAVRNL
jgi:UDP-N-acetylmuramoylalanine--D-glutamate ligase